MESGHSYLEADTMRVAIEKAFQHKKNLYNPRVGAHN